MKICEENITREIILDKVNYDPIKGIMTWRKSLRKNNIGKRLTLTNNGYRKVTFGKKEFMEHRLVWFLETGLFPLVIDHINGDRQDNRISNLRDTTPRGNASNREIHRKGKLVGYYRDGNRFKAVININKKIVYLGSFDSKHEAVFAYKKALNGDIKLTRKTRELKKGVYKTKAGKFQALGFVKKKQFYLGLFTTAEEAEDACLFFYRKGV